MKAFKTKCLLIAPDDAAPDGSDVWALLQLDSGSRAHFELASGEISIPVAHRTLGDKPLEVVGIRMPPWPGKGEAYKVEGIPDWKATHRAT